MKHPVHNTELHPPVHADGCPDGKVTGYLFIVNFTLLYMQMVARMAKSQAT